MSTKLIDKSFYLVQDFNKAANQMHDPEFMTYIETLEYEHFPRELVPYLIMAEHDEEDFQVKGFFFKTVEYKDKLYPVKKLNLIDLQRAVHQLYLGYVISKKEFV